MDNKKSYVYKITCKITGEFYFGSSFRANSDSYWGGGKRIRERIAQYGKENFVKEILGEFFDRTEAHRVENVYIEQFRNDYKCLNQQLDHKFGTYSDEIREKRSAALRGKHHTDESRAKMSVAQRGEKNHNFGKHLSEEAKAKIGAARLGKHLSDETRAKIGAAKRVENLSDETRARMSAAKLGKHWRKNPVTGKREWYD